MYSNGKAAIALRVAFGIATLAEPAWCDAEYQIIFDIKGELRAVNLFLKNYWERAKEFKTLSSSCQDPIPYLDESYVLHEIIVCSPAGKVFTETEGKDVFGEIGAVFVKTTTPKSPVPDLSMAVTPTLSCGSQKCQIEGGTPCWSPSCAGTGICLHYPHTCSESTLHKCK